MINTRQRLMEKRRQVVDALQKSLGVCHKVVEGTRLDLQQAELKEVAVKIYLDDATLALEESEARLKESEASVREHKARLIGDAAGVATATVAKEEHEARATRLGAERQALITRSLEAAQKSTNHSAAMLSHKQQLAAMDTAIRKNSTWQAALTMMRGRICSEPEAKVSTPDLLPMAEFESAKSAMEKVLGEVVNEKKRPFSSVCGTEGGTLHGVSQANKRQGTTPDRKGEVIDPEVGATSGVHKVENEGGAGVDSKRDTNGVLPSHGTLNASVDPKVGLFRTQERHKLRLTIQQVSHPESVSQCNEAAGSIEPECLGFVENREAHDGH